MTIIKPRIRFIEKFLEHFNSAFSTKHQRSVFRELIYGMFTDYKRMSLAIIANNTHMNYQKLQYFFSEANWNINKLNDIRMRLLQNQRTTRAYPGGVLAIYEPTIEVNKTAMLTTINMFESAGLVKETERDGLFTRFARLRKQ